MTMLRVVERGHTDLDQGTTRRLLDNTAFLAMLDRSLLSLSYLSHGRARLNGGFWVGRAIVGDVALQIDEKIDGAVAALLADATHGAVRLERKPTNASELGALATFIIDQFLDAVHAYASRGLNNYYVTVGGTSPLGGGRINTTKTILLHAQGQRHLLAFDRDILCHDTPINRVVRAALGEIGRFAATIPVSHRAVARTRGLCTLFDDNRGELLLPQKRSDLLADAIRLSEGAYPEHIRDLLALATIILAHQSFEPHNRTEKIVPRAWFLNLEMLFEVATCRIIGGLCGDRARTLTGKSISPPCRIFPSQARKYRAQPDIVLRVGHETIAVGDVKYKTWKGSASEDDLYQLVVHAAAFQAPICFLVFPHDRFEAIDLGLSATGCRTWVFAVDMRQLQDNLRLVLQAVAPALLI